MFLLRFLRARKFHADKAWAMVEEHLEWRRRGAIDDLASKHGAEVLGAPSKSCGLSYRVGRRASTEPAPVRDRKREKEGEGGREGGREGERENCKPSSD